MHRIDKKRFRLSDSSQVLGPNLLHAEIEGTLTFSCFNHFQIPLVEEIEDLILGFDVKNHDAVQELLNVAHIIITDGSSLFIQDSHPLQSSHSKPVVTVAS